MTTVDLLKEYETHLAYSGEPLKECPLCGRITHRAHCPNCKTADGRSLSLTGDKQLDDTVARIENGEEIEDLDAILRAGFEPVPRG